MFIKTTIQHTILSIKTSITVQIISIKDYHIFQRMTTVYRFFLSQEMIFENRYRTFIDSMHISTMIILRAGNSGPRLG